MKIKTTLRLIDFSQSSLVIILVFSAVLVTSRARNGVALTLEFSLGSAGIILYLFRSVIVNRVLKKSAHPGLMYAVLEKLGYTQKLNLYLPDEMLDEIYKPSYPTSEFLAENDLPTEFGPELSFNEKGLRLGDEVLSWTSIFDWNYVKGSKTTTSRIWVNYYDTDGNIQKDDIKIGVGRNEIDVLLMLTHFKGK